VVTPADWKEVRLGEIAEIISGGTPSTAIGSYWGGDIPWCTPTDITSCKSNYLFETERKITPAGLAGSAASLLPPGSLLLCTRATVGDVRIAGRAIATNQGFKSLVVNSQANSKFVYFVLQTLRPAMIEKSSGSTFLELGKNDLSNIVALMPPLKEQEAIAEALNDADAAIESLDALIAKKRDVKQAAMQQLLTGRTRLPGFTADWKEVRLGEVGSLRGGTGFPLRFQGRKSGEVPFYKVSDMNLHGNEIRMYDSNNWISEGDSRVLGAALFPKGSIVFAKVGAAVFLERKRILTRSSCIDNNMMAIIPDSSWTDVRFLHFSLQMVRFADLVSATALPSINASGVAGISLAMPAVKEQKAIAEALTVMDDELEALTQQLSKLRMVKEGMMQDLLTGKVRLV
jgi:type I restriction enzyme S subunit